MSKSRATTIESRDFWREVLAKCLAALGSYDHAPAGHREPIEIRKQIAEIEKRLSNLSTKRS